MLHVGMKHEQSIVTTRLEPCDLSCAPSQLTPNVIVSYYASVMTHYQPAASLTTTLNNAFQKAFFELDPITL